MNQIDLIDQVAVVTGGAQGIGYAVAERMLRSGAEVHLWDADGPLVRKAAADLGAYGPVTAHEVDQTDPTAVEEAARAVAESRGRIDILTNNAGIAGPSKPLLEYTLEEWRLVIDVDLNGMFNCCRAVVPLMVENGYGRVVNVSSVAGKEGNPNASAYSAAKAGVLALSKSLAKEVAHLDIAVNSVTPATAKTRILEQISDEQVDYMLQRIPRGRFVQVEEVAAMVVWMVSRENSFTTGAAFDLSGGRTTY